MLTCVLGQLVVDRNRVEGLIVLNLIANRFQMMPSSRWHLLSVELNRSWRRLLVFPRRSNFIEHWHIVMLVLHARSSFTLLAKLFLRDTTWQWPDIFFSLAWMSFRAANLWAIRALHMLHQMWCWTLNLLALTLATVSIALERRLLLRYHIHLATYVFIFLLLDPIHAF